MLRATGAQSKGGGKKKKMKKKKRQFETPSSETTLTQGEANQSQDED